MKEKQFTQFEANKKKYLRCNRCGKWFENKGNRKKKHLENCYHTQEKKYVSNEKET